MANENYFWRTNLFSNHLSWNEYQCFLMSWYDQPVVERMEERIFFKRVCRDCDKTYRSECKYQLYCKKCKTARRKNAMIKIKNKLKCCICGEKCSGKMKIEARKGTEYIFCTFHFNRYEFTPLKELRKIIKENKKLLE